MPVPSRLGCCSYTVRCYDSAGETLWTQDFFRGATADSDPDMSLSVAVVGGYVFVAGPRVESSASAGTFWNLCRFDLTTGALVSRHDLWPAGVPYNLETGNGDINDICGGADGNLGVVFWTYDTQGDTTTQYFAAYSPATMAEQWVAQLGLGGTPYQPFNRSEIAIDGVMHIGGEGNGRWAFAIEGDSEYTVGGQGFQGFWFGETGFLALVPNTAVPHPTTLGTIYGGQDVGFDPHLTEAGQTGGPGEVLGYSPEWNSLCTRWNGVVTENGGGGLDTGNVLSEIGITRDGSGTAIDVIVLGDGQVRGETASAPINEPDEFGAIIAYATSGDIAETGSVGRFSLSGEFTKTYSPFDRAWARVATVNGAGYFLGAGRSTTLPTLAYRAADDSHVWAHKHQAITDVVVTLSGGCVTAGDRSRRSTSESDFLTP